LFISQHNVFDMLEGISYRSLIKTDEMFRFERSYFLTEGEHFSSPEMLYVCTFNVLQNATCETPENVCVLCIGDMDEIALYAESTPLNIIAVSDEIPLTYILNLIHELFYNLLRWSYMVNSRLGLHADFQALIELCKVVFGDNPLLLVNSSYNVIAASSTNSGGHPRLQQILDRGYFPKDTVDALAKMGYHRNSYRFTTPMSYDSNFMGCPFLMTTFYDNHVYYGFMVIYFIDGKEPTVGQLGLFTWFAKKMQQHLLRRMTPSNAVPSQKEAFISDLLLHTKEDDEYLADRARSLKIPMDMNYRICVIQWKNYSRPQTEYVLWRLKNDLDLPAYRVLIYQNKLILLMNGDLPGISIEEKSRYSSQTIRSLLDTGDAYAGFSLPGFPLMKINIAFQQALSAAEIGLQLAPEDKLYFYSKYYVYEMLRDYSERYALDTVGISHLAKLHSAKEDEFDNYSLLRTFLLTERNLSLTARLMHMHRNSVIYRLKRIEENMIVDLDDPDTRLRLMLSFKILELMDGKLGEPLPQEGEVKTEDPLFFE